MIAALTVATLFAAVRLVRNIITSNKLLASNATGCWRPAG
jgi:hypothetical protein